MEAVGRPYVGKEAREVVAEVAFNVVSDVFLGMAGTGQEYGSGGGLRPFDALGVIVGDGGALACQLKDILEGLSYLSHRADAHGRTIAVTAVGLGVA